jgi:ligand-binding SRPBCC domain-containing protein
MNDTNMLIALLNFKRNVQRRRNVEPNPGWAVDELSHASTGVPAVSGVLRTVVAVLDHDCWRSGTQTELSGLTHWTSLLLPEFGLRPGSMKTFELHQVVWLPNPVEEIFEFFVDASNLAFLTPDWLRFRVMTPLPIRMQAGTEIDYQIRLRGLPLRWTSRVSRWSPPEVFVDEQILGPYRLWVHEHRFVAARDGTEVRDHVRYAVWGGNVVNRLFVEPDLRRIFKFRADQLVKRFRSA